jgi:RHS repeat-associated protein
VTAYLYDAWGQVKSQTGSLANPFTYTSREAGEAGLNFYRARYYQPTIGRFLQEDPVRSTLAAYALVVNSPVAFSDPTGEFACPSGCSCSSRSESRTLDLGTRPLWELFKQTRGRGWCYRHYRYAGNLHMWQPYLVTIWTITCPPCDQYSESESFYGKPYETPEPVMSAPHPAPEPLVTRVPETVGGCFCRQRL